MKTFPNLDILVNFYKNMDEGLTASIIGDEVVIYNPINNRLDVYYFDSTLGYVLEN